MKKLVFNVAALRITFGVVWLIDAILKWLPGFQNNATNDILTSIQGQPTWIAWPLTQFMDMVAHFPHAFPITVAVLETLVAIALILGFGRRVTYIVGMVVSLGIWVVGEGFGGPYGNDSTDIGASVIYIFVFWGLLLLDRAVKPSWSLDNVIAKKRQK